MSIRFTRTMQGFLRTGHFKAIRPTEQMWQPSRPMNKTNPIRGGPLRLTPYVGGHLLSAAG